MAPLIAKRMMALIPVLFGISVIAFLSLALCPGDPAELALSRLMETETPPREAVVELRRELGYDRPLPIRYALWLSRVVRGEMGDSIQTGQPVSRELGHALAASAMLAGCALVLTVLVVVPLGAASAIRAGSPLDKAALGLALACITLPDFFLAVLLILVFAIWLDVLPVAGYGQWTNILLPAMTLALSTTAISLRLMRTSTLQILGSRHLLTARSKGLTEARVVFRHALRPALPPVVNYLGAQAGHLIGGAVVVESIFMWPGLGRLMVEAVRARDVFVVQGCVLVMGTAFVLVTLAVDILHAALDPRVRDQGGAA